MYSNPARVIAVPAAFTNSSGTGGVPRTAIQARRSAVVSFKSGRHLSLRPLPTTRILGVRSRRTFSSGSPTNSETRSPPAKQRCIMARSRIPRRVVVFGELRIVRTHSIVRCRTSPWSCRLLGMAWICCACANVEGTRNSTYRMNALKGVRSTGVIDQPLFRASALQLDSFGDVRV